MGVVTDRCLNHVPQSHETSLCLLLWDMEMCVCLLRYREVYVDHILLSKMFLVRHSRSLAIARLRDKNVIQLNGKVEPKALLHDLTIYFNYDFP